MKKISISGSFPTLKHTLISMMLVLAGFFSLPAIGQTFPPVDRCTSKDLELVNATLTGGDACNSCTPGQTLTRTLTLGINNKTGSTRPGFAFWGTLEITHSDGTVSTSSINRCSGPIPSTGPLPAYYDGGNFGTITYQCGDALRIINLYLAWTDASKGCPINSATINPKCGTLPSIQINAGVNGGFVIADATCTAGGSIAVSPFGGRAPYSVVCGGVTHSPIAGGATTSFSNLPDGSYAVSITDANNCVINFNKTVGAATPLGTPAATVTQPTCTVATGTVTVTSPVSGMTYTLKQGGVVIYTAVNGVFSSVATGTYTFHVSNGTCSTAGTNKTINAQPPTPDAPEVCIVQPSLCGPATGSVTILSPTGSGYEYSINNGTSWQSGTVFSNVAAGSVTGIKVKKDGCVSAPADCDDSNCSAANKIADQTPVEAVEPIANSKADLAGFDAFPVPFKDQLTVKYKFNYQSPVKIEIFNSRGISVLSRTDTNGYENKETIFNFNIDKNEMYFVKLTTNRGSTVKKVVSSR